jgi:hypothetical protein
MRLMFASQRKAFPRPPVNVGNKSVILTAVNLTKTRGPRLTANWNRGERPAACRQRETV